MGLTDSDILEGVIAGDQSLYKQLFLRYYTIIYRFLLRMLSDSETAEDIAQNIFMKIWIRRETLNPNGSIKNYLYVMAKNEAINQLKRNGFVIMESEMPQVMSSQGTDDSLLYHEMLDSFERRISSMPAQRQNVFRMSRQEQLSNKEIAGKLKLSVRTVEKHIELALKDLRTQKTSIIAVLIYVVSAF